MESDTQQNTWIQKKQDPQSNTLYSHPYTKHAYKLTAPDLSATAKISYHQEDLKIADQEDEQLYLQSYLPYLGLLALIFIVNGLILFFGQSIKELIQTQWEEEHAKPVVAENWQHPDWKESSQKTTWLLPDNSASRAYLPGVYPEESVSQQRQTNLFQ